MSIQFQLKRLIEELPLPFAKIAASIPFEWRLGPTYARMSRMVRRLDDVSSQKVRKWAFPRLKHIVDRSYNDNKFYRIVCERNKFTPEKFKTLEHFVDAPIIKKKGN